MVPGVSCSSCTLDHSPMLGVSCNPEPVIGCCHPPPTPMAEAFEIPKEARLSAEMFSCTVCGFGIWEGLSLDPKSRLSSYLFAFLVSGLS